MEAQELEAFTGVWDMDSPTYSNNTFIGKLRHYCPSLYFTLSTWERDHLDTFFPSESSFPSATIKTVDNETILESSDPLNETVLVSSISPDARSEPLLPLLLTKC
jgi:hypothetical protein